MITIYPVDTAKKDIERPYFFEILNRLTGLEVLPFSTARAAMVYGLRALGFGRTDELLVPPYLGQCVLSALTRTAFPTMISSFRTKGIMVFHQFGYPQRIAYIEKAALKKGWIILNNCAHTIFSMYEAGMVLDWGDFSVLSFSKIYPCTLGGALISDRDEIQERVNRNYKALSADHTSRVSTAYKILEKGKRRLLGAEAKFKIDAVYGYLPELVSFPSETLLSLPNTVDEIVRDTNRRRQVLDIVRFYFPERVPDCPDCDVVPFAVPVAGDPAKLEKISCRIREETRVDVPVLHFDFARNMLDPDYRKSLVIGCHGDWSEDIVNNVCKIIKSDIR